MALTLLISKRLRLWRVKSEKGRPGYEGKSKLNLDLGNTELFHRADVFYSVEDV